MPTAGANIWLANPRGFCAGVERAIEIVNLLLQKHGAPIYVKHEVVHNTFVIEELTEKGAVFIEDVTAVPAGSILVFSAHGVSQQVRKLAAAGQLEVHDATCPLVSKIHAQVHRLAKAGYKMLLIGHDGHPEVEGTMGQIEEGISLVENIADVQALDFAEDVKLAYVTQTTLSVDDTREIIEAIRKRFPHVVDPVDEDICYATQNRQDAVKQMAGDCDLLLVVGSATSSNSNRLCEVAKKCGTPAKLVDRPQDVDPAWFNDCHHVGVTSGASAPEVVLTEVVETVRSYLPDARITELDGVTENVYFAVPKALTRS